MNYLKFLLPHLTAGIKYSKKILLLMLLSTLTYANKNSVSIDLEIKNSDKNIHLSKQTLLKHPQLSQISISNDRAYPNRIMHHQVIALCRLLTDFPIKKDDIIEFISNDNFHVYVPAEKIVPCDDKQAMAMLAIEPDKRWPIIDNHTQTTAGPYEIIWLHPERSYISDEYWAWSVVSIKISNKMDYKEVMAPPETKNKAIINGYGFYISHCEGCHTLNHVGKSHIGPDLNCPKNPWEYYTDEKILKQFIRDPKSVRNLANSRMSGSSKQFLSDNDLNDLLQFYNYMQQHKKC